MADDLEAGWERERQVAEARELREQALADCAELAERLQQRAAEGPTSAWVLPPEPPPRQREQPSPRPVAAPAPPIPTEYSRPQHGPDGRIRGIEKFTGSAAQSARSWEAYIRREIRAHVARQLDALGAEIATDVNELEARLAEQAAQIDALTVRVLQLETRAAGGPREVLDAAD